MNPYSFCFLTFICTKIYVSSSSNVVIWKSVAPFCFSNMLLFCYIPKYCWVFRITCRIEGIQISIRLICHWFVIYNTSNNPIPQLGWIKFIFSFMHKVCNIPSEKYPLLSKNNIYMSEYDVLWITINTHLIILVIIIFRHINIIFW